MNNKLKWMLLVLFLGFIDTVYLSYVHFSPGSLFCPSITSQINCEAVLSSAFSSFLGIPISILGLLWIFGCIFLIFKKVNRVIRNLWLIIGICAVGYSVTAMVIIGKICIYCTALDIIIVTTVIMFIKWHDVGGIDLFSNDKKPK